jgi:hypothetical protein
LPRDRAEPLLAAAGVLARHQSQLSSEVAPAVKRFGCRRNRSSAVAVTGPMPGTVMSRRAP